MKSEIKNKLINWSKSNNRHDNDDKLLYEIVLETLNEKIDSEDFKSIVGEDNYNMYFRIYEHLVSFAKFIGK